MRKDSGIAYLLWLTCFVGLCGVHRLYLGRYVTGALWLVTFGLLGIGQFIDLFLINGMVRRENREALYEEALMRAAARAGIPPA